MRWKRVLLVVAVVLVAGFVGLFFWARSILAGDLVRQALESQLTGALGQPVTIGRVHASVLPRVTLNLSDVVIGRPGRVKIAKLHVGADVRALLSRRIERAVVRLDGARIELPLPAMTFGPAPASTGSAPSAASSIQIVSIDRIELTNVEVVSGGRVLRGSVDIVPRFPGAEIRRVSLAAEGTSLDLTGAITDLAGPTGDLTIKAAGLNVLELLAFVSDFSKGAGIQSRATSRPARGPAPMNLVVAIDAGRATVGDLLLDAVSGRARITPAAVTFEAVRFGVFDGQYRGALAWRLTDVPGYDMQASVAGLDTAKLAAFLGHAGAMTGRLSGTVDLAGRGTAVDDVLASARGTARVDIKDGTVPGLGLVRGVVLATSMRQESRATVRGADTNRPEPFSSLAATLAVAAGSASTDDLTFVSTDVHLAGAGVFALRSGAVEAVGRLQLSEELSRQAGRDLLRYTKDEGRVTVPITVTGTPGNLRVALDAGETARRAVTNRAAEEAKKLLGRIIKKR